MDNEDPEWTAITESGQASGSGKNRFSRAGVGQGTGLLRITPYPQIIQVSTSRDDVTSHLSLGCVSLQNG